MTQGIRVEVLGPLRLLRDGEELDLGGAKQAAVLAALVVEQGRAITIDRLVDRLWEEDPPPSAVATLHAYVSNLRRLLEPGHERGTPFRVLVTRARGYALEIGDDQSDVRAFERLAEEGRALLGEGRPVNARASFRDALELWRGDPLADLTEGFARVEAARLEQLRWLIVEDDVEATLALGEHEAAVGRIRSLIATDPLRERLWAQLILALYRSGRQADALRAYQEAREILADELGIDPGPALRKLETAVLNQDPELEWRAPAEPVRSALGPAGTAIIGREREIALFEAALDEMASGRGRLVLLSGEPGIGKTRLADELMRRASQRGFSTAWGRCLEGGAAPPFWPWIQALRDVAPDVARLIPDGASTHETGRVRVYDSIVRELRELSRSAPFVVAIDDLQWGDVPSLELVRFVAESSADVPLILVATYRDTEIAPGHPVQDLLAGVARGAPVERVSVSGLEPQEIGRLIAGAIDRDPDGRVVEVLHGRTNGNPFFVTELVRLLGNELDECVDPQAVLGRGIPVGVRDVVGRRVARLPLQTAEMLDIAATIGRTFDVAVLEATSGIDHEGLLDRLEVALGAGIVVRDAKRFDRFRFSHDIVRQTIYGALPPVRRARLHQRVADVLVDLWKDEPDWVSRLAHHFWEAAAVCGPERALPFVMLAAERASDQLAYEAAERHLERGLALASSLPPSREAELTALYAASRLSRLRSILRGYAAPETGEALEATRGLAERTDAGEELLTALWGLWGYHCVRAEWDESQRYTARMEEEALRRDHAGFAFGARVAAGVVDMHLGDHERSRRRLEDGIVLAEAILDPRASQAFQQDPSVSVRCFLAVVEALGGDFDAAEGHAREAIELAEKIEDTFTLSFALMMGAWAAMLMGDAAGAGDLAARARAMSDEYGFRLNRDMAGSIEGWAIATQGDPGAGESLVASSIADFEATGARMLMPYYVGLLGQVQRLAGKQAEGTATLRSALDTANRTGEHLYDRHLAEMLGLPAVAGGHSSVPVA